MPQTCAYPGCDAPVLPRRRGGAYKNCAAHANLPCVCRVCGKKGRYSIGGKSVVCRRCRHAGRARVDRKGCAVPMCIGTYAARGLCWHHLRLVYTDGVPLDAMRPSKPTGAYSYSEGTVRLANGRIVQAAEVSFSRIHGKQTRLGVAYFHAAEPVRVVDLAFARVIDIDAPYPDGVEFQEV